MQQIHLRHKISRFAAFACLMQVVLAGCGGGGDPSAQSPTPPPPPSPPSPALPTLSISDVSISEGASGTVLATFNVNLSVASSQIVTVDYATQDSTAIAGNDYIATSGTLTFAANAMTATIVVSVQGDTTVEPDEMFFVNLARPTNATLAIARGVGRMNNDDVAAALSIAAVSNALLTDDSQAIEVQLGAPAGASGERVTLSSSNAAIAALVASVNIPAGETVGYVELTTSATAGNATLTATTSTGIATLDIAVAPRDLVMAGSTTGLWVTQTAAATVTLQQPAPAGGVTIDLVSSDVTRASVAPTTITILAGASVANFTITALARGGALITARIAGNAARAEPLPISVVSDAPVMTESSEALIEQARISGALTNEQAFLYRLRAAYDVASLPAQYRGTPGNQPHSPVMRELGRSKDVVSAAGKAELESYLRPPIYAGSSGSLVKQLVSDGRKSAQQRVVAQSADTICDVAGTPFDPSLIPVGVTLVRRISESG
ncbi:MAG: hypothetical protein H7Y02_05010, partial [Candidatus Obscuribacterales bacterium]|nr:hypothetical protein [Steroidobacteraceae bacterium]